MAGGAGTGGWRGVGGRCAASQPLHVSLQRRFGSQVCQAAPAHEAAPRVCRVQDGAQAVQRIERPEGVAHIETLLVAQVVAAHARHMQAAAAVAGQPTRPQQQDAVQ